MCDADLALICRQGRDAPRMDPCFKRPRGLVHKLKLVAESGILGACLLMIASNSNLDAT